MVEFVKFTDLPASILKSLNVLLQAIVTEYAHEYAIHILLKVFPPPVNILFAVNVHDSFMVDVHGVSVVGVKVEFEFHKFSHVPDPIITSVKEEAKLKAPADTFALFDQSIAVIVHNVQDN